MQLYLTSLGQRRRNNGRIAPKSLQCALSSTRKFLAFLNRPVTSTTLSELIAQTRKQHRQDDFSTDDALLRFASLNPIIMQATRATFIKGIFRVNRCPLQATFNTHFSRPTKKISAGILKAIYESQSEEKQKLMDYQAYAGERIACLCRRVTTNQFEDFDDKYTLVRVEEKQTKARYWHICIVPRNLADWIRGYARQRRFCQTTPFINYETLWREITKFAYAEFGVRFTSHYLRKRFHTIAGKTRMPVNSWDYLMGDKQSWGHEAGTYTLEDFTELVQEYDRFLAPYLSIENPTEPDDPKEPFAESALFENLHRENQELKEQIIRLTRLLTEKLTERV